MSKGNEQDRRVRTRKTLESITQECPVTVTDSCNLNVPSQKRKEDAKKILYLNRV